MADAAGHDQDVPDRVEVQTPVIEDELEKPLEG